MGVHDASTAQGQKRGKQSKLGHTPWPPAHSRGLLLPPRTSKEKNDKRQFSGGKQGIGKHGKANKRRSDLAVQGLLLAPPDKRRVAIVPESPDKRGGPGLRVPGLRTFRSGSMRRRSWWLAAAVPASVTSTAMYLRAIRVAHEVLREAWCPSTM